MAALVPGILPHSVARLATACGIRERPRGRSTKDGISLWLSHKEAVCDKMGRSSPGAQTKRRGDAGPVRDLLGGKAAPADV